VGKLATTATAATASLHVTVDEAEQLELDEA